MPAPVDHAERRQRILDASLRLFTKHGYSGVTFGDIATECRIARTTIYRYFSDKRQVFSYAIDQLTDRLDAEFRQMARDGETLASEKVRGTLNRVMDTIFEHRILLAVIFEYLLHEKQFGADIRQGIRRRTIGMRFLLSHLVKEGIDRGEFIECPADTVGATLYGILESAILQLAVTDTADRKLLDSEVDFILTRLSADTH